MENLSSKQALRTHFKRVRASLCEKRRQEARAALAECFSFLSSYSNILSFASFDAEIDISLLNTHLARAGTLLLPKMVDDQLHIFRVTDLDTLIPTSFGLPEPSQESERLLELNTIEVVLVPALGFDRFNHRLGYGKGYYDRFLKQVPQAQTIGIGFKEQSISHLPVHSTDVALMKVSLF